MSSTLAKRLRIALALFVVGCGSTADGESHHVSANYDRKCASVADCVPVFEGTVGCCGLALTCPNTAIRADALAQYMSAAERASKCAVQPPCPSGGMCTSGRIVCQAGTCALEVPSDAATTE
jgi:hypothetical protein